ncbi:hypothetical protein FHR70_000698 [Microvirga lupini]|uniref:Uncharacterized protein n=1 Tax=Microvirga lupini TaxID=420324 RepID=A0A7W4VI48_9HYPH|nr:hypothetical protein [Microvirga lupini]MBB3017658.1 hypothetical protein [Microvirga lupini]
MKYFELPVGVVLTGLGNARLIHQGGGVFVCSDAHAPKVFEVAAPEGEALDTSAVPELESIADYGGVWQLGKRDIEQPAPAEEPEPVEEPAE